MKRISQSIYEEEMTIIRMKQYETGAMYVYQELFVDFIVVFIRSIKMNFLAEKEDFSDTA